MFQVHHLHEKIGFQQCSCSWISTLLQSLFGQSGASRNTEDLFWHQHNCSIWRKRMSKVFIKNICKESKYQKKKYLRLLIFFFRCGGSVFEAEKVTVKEDFYHKKCLTCTKCSRTLDSLALTVAPDGNVYCKVIENHLYLYVLHKLKKKIDFNSFSEKKILRYAIRS